MNFKQFDAYGIVLQGCDVRLNSLLQIASGNQCSSQVDVPVDEIWFEAHSMAVIVKGLL